MSKFGFHISAGVRKGLGDCLDQCTKGGSPVKVINAVDQDIWVDLQKYSPKTILIYRHQFEGQDFPPDLYAGTEAEIRARAVKWMNDLRPNWELNKAHFYANMNEPNPTPAQFPKLAIFMDECINLADAWGYKLAMPAFSTGTPSDDGSPQNSKWADLVPVLMKMKQSGHILNLHEYGYDKTLKDSAPWHALRFRSVLDFLAPLNADPKIVITEASTGAGYDGNQNNIWLNDLAWYDNELMNGKWNEHIIGFCAYQLGGAENFNAILPAITTYIISHPDREPTVQTVTGIDVSFYQQTVDWEKVKSVAKFAFIKATQGSSIVDPQFVNNWKNAKGKVARGAYHYYIFAEDYLSQANKFISTLNGDYGELPLVVDMEDPSLGRGADIIKFVEEVKNRTGKQVIIYTANWWTSTNLIPADRYISLARYDLWVASYTPSPIIPKPWTTYRFWQKGQTSVPGIYNSVDYNIFNGSLEEFNSYLSVSTPSLTESTEGTKSPDKIVDTGLNIWTLGTQAGPAGYPVLKNGSQYQSGLAILIYYHNHNVYVKNNFGEWYQVVLSGWLKVSDPTAVLPVLNTLRGVGMGNLYSLTPNDLSAISISKINAIKLLTLPDPADNTKLVNQVKTLFIISRLFFQPNVGFNFTPQEFCSYINNGITAQYNAGVRYFEVHNEPNINPEGLGWNWNNGLEFGNWLVQVLNILRPKFPQAKFGYPGLSPQINTEQFFKDSKFAADKCDWVGVHSYWISRGNTGWGMESIDGGLNWTRFLSWTNKPLYLTEFSNNSATVSDTEKGQQYKDYYKLINGKVLGAFCFALNWDSDINNEAWVRKNIITQIPYEIGK